MCEKNEKRKSDVFASVVCVPFHAFVCVALAAYRIRKKKEAGKLQTGIQILKTNTKSIKLKCRSNLEMCDSAVLCFSATTVYY